MERLKFLDGLRGIAATWVMLVHLAARVPNDLIFRNGYLGVAIFFVLSGFVIAMMLDRRKITAGFAGRFALRRMIRLDIPYWVSLTVVLVLAALATRFAGVPALPLSVPQVIAHGFYLQDLLGYSELGSVYWTLCFEVQFYLSLMGFLWLDLRGRYFSTFLLASMALSAILSAIAGLNMHGTMMQYWWAFALGALTFWTTSGRCAPVTWVMGCAILAATAGYGHESWRLMALFTAAAIYVASQSQHMQEWLSQAPFQFMGRISYSLYLFHFSVGWSAQSFALRYADRWSAFAAGIAASVVSAWVAYRLIESTSIRLSRCVKLEPPILFDRCSRRGRRFVCWRRSEDTQPMGTL